MTNNRAAETRTFDAHPVVFAAKQAFRACAFAEGVRGKETSRKSDESLPREEQTASWVTSMDANFARYCILSRSSARRIVVTPSFVLALSVRKER